MSIVAIALLLVAALLAIVDLVIVLKKRRIGFRGVMYTPTGGGRAIVYWAFVALIVGLAVCWLKLAAQMAFGL